MTSNVALKKFPKNDFMDTFEILHTCVPPDHPTLTEGHWFFDTGQWCQCASMGCGADGRWTVEISLVPHWQESDTENRTFNSEADAIQFISAYFRAPVRTVLPSEFPDDSEL